MGAEIAEAKRERKKGALTCMKEHRSVDIGNAPGHERMYGAYLYAEI